jgi:phosphoglycerol transferase MdoB-like AlkP superfamily enzyme
MSILSKQKIIVIALYMMCSILIESITFLFNNYGLLPKYFMFFFAGLLLLSSFLVLFNQSKRLITIASIFLFIQMLISFANVNLLKITGEVFSWDMLTIIHEAARAAGKGISVTFLYLLSVLPILLGFMYVANRLIKQARIETIITPKIKIVSTMIMMLMAAFSALIFESQTNFIHQRIEHNPVTIISDSYLINTFYVKQEAYKKLGTMGYYVLSGIRSISNRLQGNYINTMLEKLNDYIAKQSRDGEMNDFTGISSGNNLIVILIETWDYTGSHPDFTPNLYALLKDSLLLSEYYSKDQTNISESKTIFGSYPLTGILNYNYDKNIYPFTLPNMFKSTYPTSDVISFHNNDGKYYDRNRAHVQFGFDQHIDASTMQLSINELWINLDSEMFASALSSQKGSTSRLIIPEDTSKPFFSYVTTFASHGPFVYRSEFVEEYEYISNYQNEVTTYLGDTIDLSNQYVQTYLAALMDLDKGIGYLMDELEERDLLNSTTIALVSDHYAYYHNYAHTTKSLPITNETNPLIYKVPALIYDKKMMKHITDNPSLQQEYHIMQDQYLDISFYICNKFFTNTDLVPTILNLHGIVYNQAYYMGNDLFSTNQSLVLSRWGGVFDNEFYSIDGITIENLPFKYDETTIETIDVEWLSSIDDINEMIKLHEKVIAFRIKASEFFTKYEYIDMMYVSNYFYYLNTNQENS